MAAAMRARRVCSDCKITVIEHTGRISIANCIIPAYLADDVEDINELQLLSPQTAISEHRIDVFTHHKAQNIQPSKRALSVENLETSQVLEITYDRLILSTGASPILLDVPNNNTEGVFKLRNLHDALEFRNFLERRKPESITVIGTGSIAQTCAAALHKRGMEITMIGIEKTLMPDLHPLLSERIIRTLEMNNINVYTDDIITNLKASLDASVQAVVTDKRTINCDCILFTVGVKPNVDLARSASINLGKTGAIKVDRRLTTSRSGIYACGDCAETHHIITNKPIYYPSATTAARQGRAAGENAVGGNSINDTGTLTSSIWRCFDLIVGRAGLSNRQAADAGFYYKTTLVQALSKPTQFGGDYIDIIIVSDSESGRLLGVQIAGMDGVHARLNAFVGAITAKMTLHDIEALDFPYSPEISNLRDPMNIAGRIGQKNQDR